MSFMEELSLWLYKVARTVEMGRFGSFALKLL